MTSEDEVLDYIRKALKKPLVYPEEIAALHRYKTPIEWYRNQPKSWDSEFDRRPRAYAKNDPFKEELAELIKRGFGHVTANPSRPGNVAAHQSTYVFASGSGHFVEPAEDKPVNWSEDTTNDFIGALSVAALKTRKLYEERYYPDQSRGQDLSTEKLHQSAGTKWVLLGDRGVGKTSFLNYMLATRTPQLHSQRVVWTRIDLTKEYDEKITLEKIIQWQMLQILFRYYDQTTWTEEAQRTDSTKNGENHWTDKFRNRMIFDLSGDNKEIFRYARALVGQSNLTMDKFRVALNRARVEFLTNETAAEISDAWLFRAIWDYLTITGQISFLVIIDGLDQLGLSLKDKKRFEYWHQSVRTTLFQEGTLAAAYLVTMRYQSFSHELSDDRFRRGFRSAYVASIPSKIIWERKLAYLKNWSAFEKNWLIASRMGATGYSDFIDAFCTAYMEFASYSLSFGIEGEVASTDINAGFARLDEIFGNNKRKAFEALTNSVSFFIRMMPNEFDKVMNRLVVNAAAKELGPRIRMTSSALPDISRYQYIFIESLMLEDTTRTLRAPRYTFIPASKSTPKNFRSNGRQEFMFNVFAVPFMKGVEKPIVSLYGLRVIQLFHAEGTPIARDEAIQDLIKYFGYDEEMLENTLDDLMDGGVLSDAPLEEFTFPNTIELTDRGRYIHKRLIKSVEYLNLALQAAPLPAYLVDKGLFPIRRYNCPEYVLYNKIICTLNFVRFLKMVEAQEQSLFDTNIGTTPFGRFNYRTFKNGGFSFADDVESSVIGAIQHMISRAWKAGSRRKGEFIRLVDEDLLRVV